MLAGLVAAVRAGESRVLVVRGEPGVEAARNRPLVCLVDDQQWLDQASAQALGFAARRLAADPVGLVFAARVPGAELAGLPELAVEGLRERDARALLDSALVGPLDARVRDQIVTETEGNPLALLELPRGMTSAELAGGFGLPGQMSLTGRIEDSFQRRLDALPAPTRRLLLLAAADPSGDPSLVWRAAGRLELPVQATVPAVEAGLAEFGARVRFRHPLVRSAAYRSASFAERQQVHGALDKALGLLVMTEAWPLDEFASARVTLLRGQIAFATGMGSDAPPLLLNAARRLEPLDSGLACETYLDAIAAAFYTGEAAEVSRSVRDLPRSPHPAPAELLLDGLSLLYTDGLAAAAATLGQAVSLFADDSVSDGDRLRRGLMALPLALLLWDDDGCRAILARQIQFTRGAGALDHLPIYLESAATIAGLSGDFGEAASLLAEAEAVCEVTGSRVPPLTAVHLAGLRGRPAEAFPLIDATITAALASGQAAIVAWVRWATAVLCNGLGRYDEAREAAGLAAEDPAGLYVCAWALPAR